MPKLSITINSVPLPVYQKNDIWRGGMVAFGRAERCLDDYSSRRLVKTAEVSGYYQCEYLLEEHTLLTSWSSEKPETIAEMVGPDPSLAWAKGTITTTTGNKHEIEYKLIPHTKEQAEKVFRERMIDEAAKRHATTDAMAEQLRELKQKVAEGAQRRVESDEALRGLAAKDVAKPDEKATREQEPTPEYVFRRRGATGDFWQVVFDGRELPPVRHLAGMTYLHALLARPGYTFAALDLYEMENPPPPDAVAPVKGKGLDWEDRQQYGTGGSTQRHLESETPSNLKKAKATLEAKIEEEDLSQKQRDHYLEQIECIDKALIDCRVARATGGATFEPKEKKGPRQAVAASIERSVTAFDKYPALMKHLDSSIQKGTNVSYTGGLTWQT